MKKLLTLFLFSTALWAQTKDSNPRLLTSVTFANLGTPADGTIVYCSDCTAANPVAGSGSGVVARRENGAWNGAGGTSGGTCAGLAGDVTGTCAANSIKANVGLTGVPTTPTAAIGDSTTQIASDAYVAQALASINPAVSVQAATIAVLSNTPTYSNGTAGVGATLTAGSNGALTIDGYVVLLNDRVLVKNQASALQNGVYTETTLGDGSTHYVLTRATDYNSTTNINYTGTIPVIQGSTLANTGWNLTTQIATIGTDSLSYTQAAAGSSGGPPGGNVKGQGNLASGQLISGAGGKTIQSTNLTGDATTSGSTAVTVSKINGTSFAGTSGDVVSFGASNVPADSGVVAADLVTAGSAATATGQICKSSGSSKTCTYIDFPDVHYFPAANCVNATAGSAWSLPAASTFTPSCRVGSNNLNGTLQATPSTGATAYFQFQLPSDWNTANQPFIKIYYASGANTSGTVIWTLSTGCTKSDGSVTDDPAFVAESAMGTQTMAAANRTWAQSAQFVNVTSGNNCIGGSIVNLKLVLSGTAGSAINAMYATINVPRNPVVQAN